MLNNSQKTVIRACIGTNTQVLRDLADEIDAEQTLTVKARQLLRLWVLTKAGTFVVVLSLITITVLMLH